MREREFWRCSIPAFFRMLERYQEAERREDWRAYFSGIASVLQKPPALSVAFPSWEGVDGAKPTRLRREDWPEHWKIHMGSDTEVVREIQEALMASSLRRAATGKVIQ